MSQENIRDNTSLKDSVLNLISKTSADENVGKFSYSVYTHNEGGVLCKARVRNEHSLVVDEKPILGGCDLGMSPIELLLVSLGTSQEIVFSMMASKLNIELEECEVQLTAELDVRGMLGVADRNNEAGTGLSNINYTTKLKSNASSKQLEVLIQAVKKQCPVLNILTEKVSVKGTTIINNYELNHRDKVA